MDGASVPVTVGGGEAGSRIQVQVSADGQVATIKVQGRFDCHLQQEFRQAYESAGLGRTRLFLVDLAAVPYVDSAACGMLLVFRDLALAQASEVRLVGVQPVVRRIFNLLQFQNLFRMD